MRWSRLTSSALLIAACSAAPSGVAPADPPPKTEAEVERAREPTDNPAVEPEGLQSSAPTSWATIAHGDAVEVEVEHALYRRTPDGPWYLRVRVTNTSPETIGIDLDPSTGPAIYRCEADDPEHPDPTWDGMVFFPKPLPESRRLALLELHSAGWLTVLAPGASADGFRRACRLHKGPDLRDTPLLSFWFRGEVDATDGQVVTRANHFAEFELSLPEHFYPLPDDARWAERRPSAPASLDADTIEQGLAPIREDARRCLLEHGVPLGQQVRISVDVDGATGHIVRIDLDDAWRDTELERCLGGQLRRARFTTFAAQQSGFRFGLRAR